MSEEERSPVSEFSVKQRTFCVKRYREYRKIKTKFMKRVEEEFKAEYPDCPRIPSSDTIKEWVKSFDHQVSGNAETLEDTEMNSDNQTHIKDEHEEDTFIKQESDEFLIVKEEPADSDDEYLEPAVSITQDDDDDEDEDEKVSVKVELEEGEHDIDMSPLSAGPTIDVSTISSNTPQLALNTVRAGTPVMGGSVTPWPLGQIITAHPAHFIRTTCSKIFLPPGLYSYERSNGIVSIMSVKTDGGKFEEIEGQYFVKKGDKEKHKGRVVDRKRPNTKVKRTFLSAHRRTPLQIYDEACRAEMEAEGVPKELWDEEIIKRWAGLSKEEKDEYNQKAKYHGGILPGEKKNETKDIPLPALKKFAQEVAPDLKQKKPYLSLKQNRGQLNRIIIEKWLKLTEEQQNHYRALAGLPASEGDLSKSGVDVGSK